MARGYAYAKIEYVSVRTCLLKNRVRVWYVSYANLNIPRPVRNVTGGTTQWCCKVMNCNWLYRISYVCLSACLFFCVFLCLCLFCTVFSVLRVLSRFKINWNWIEKNCSVQCKYCAKPFWKLFTFFATVLVKLLCCSCNVFYSCLSSLFYLFSKMQKYCWKKNKRILNKANQAHTSAYGSLYIGLRAYSLSNHIQWKRRNTHKNIKNTTSKTPKKASLEKSTLWMERRMYAEIEYVSVLTYPSKNRTHVYARALVVKPLMRFLLYWQRRRTTYRWRRAKSAELALTLTSSSRSSAAKATLENLNWWALRTRRTSLKREESISSSSSPPISAR